MIFMKSFSPILCITGTILLIISLIVSWIGSDDLDDTKSITGIVLLCIGEVIAVIGVFSALS